MSRDERFNTPSEIMRNFPKVNDEMKNASPCIFYQNGTSYYDNSEGHCAIIGRTGMGKSNTLAGSMGLVSNILKAKESFLIIDPKKENLYRFKDEAIKNGYKLIVIDFDNPSHSYSAWNPLTAIRKLYHSPKAEDNDFAATMLSELARSIYPSSLNEDQYWTNAAAEFFTGCVYILFEFAKTEEINLGSVARIMEASIEQVGAKIHLKKLYDLLDEKSMAKRYIATFVNAPNDTRSSIFAVAKTGIASFTQSLGLMQMLSNDTIDIATLDMDKPFAIFINKPDENSTYDSLCGFLVTQLTQHFIKLARDKYSGKLPHKLHIVLEELGSLGKSITALPNLMVASRSRNIRICLVLQSYSQLDDIYGKSKAETIYSSIGVTIGFSTNNWETLNEWANRCGTKKSSNTGSGITEPLITPSQISSMPIATALVMIGGKWKFICKFPFVEKSIGNSDFDLPKAWDSEFSSFDLKTFIEAYHKKKKEKIFNSANKSNPFDNSSDNGDNDDDDEDTSISLNDIIKHLATESADNSTESSQNDTPLKEDGNWEASFEAALDAAIAKLEDEVERNGDES